MLIAARPSPPPRHLCLLAPGALLLAGLVATAPCPVAAVAVAQPSGAVSRLHPTPGERLVATDDMPDATFVGTDILMLGHDADGAIGLIMNGERRTIERGLTVAECGPVGGDVVVAVHRPTVRLPSTRPINDDWAITAVEEVLEAMDGGAELEDLVLCVGYAGWGPGQLSGELSEGVWRVEGARVR